MSEFRYFRLNEFRSIFDGWGSIANSIRGMIDGSLPFYNETLTSFEELVRSYYTVGKEPGPKNLLETLRTLIQRNQLTLAHIVFLNYHMLYYLDLVNGLKPTLNKYLQELGNEDPTPIIISLAAQYPKVVPFTSPRGTFGLNTFLYLYLILGRIPISCSTHPFPVHSGSFQTGFEVAFHDFGHMELVEGRLDHLMPRIRKTYLNLFLYRDQSLLYEQFLRYIIVILFFSIHEVDLIIDQVHPLINNPSPELMTTLKEFVKFDPIDFDLTWEYLIANPKEPRSREFLQEMLRSPATDLFRYFNSQ